MKKALSLALYCVAALAIFGATTASAANLIVNGGFENPDISQTVGLRDGNIHTNWNYYASGSVPGWNGDNIEIWNSASIGKPDYEGVQHTELNSHGQGAPFSIYQTIDTTVDQTYQLDFAYIARDDPDEYFYVGVNNGAVAPTSGSGDIFSQLVDDHVTGQWSTFTDTFTATSGLTTIFFYTDMSGTRGNFIDGVSVSAVPVPAAVWLFGSALIGFMGFSRRNIS